PRQVVLEPCGLRPVRRQRALRHPEAMGERVELLLHGLAPARLVGCPCALAPDFRLEVRNSRQVPRLLGLEGVEPFDQRFGIREEPGGAQRPLVRGRSPLIGVHEWTILTSRGLLPSRRHANRGSLPSQQVASSRSRRRETWSPSCSEETIDLCPRRSGSSCPAL